MKSTFLAIPAILANLAVAAPVEKRDVVWTSVTVEDYTTVPTYTTVYVDVLPTEASAAGFAPTYSHSEAASELPSTTAAATSSAAPPPPPAPSTTSTSSAYIPPPPPSAPSSSSTPYVAPAPSSSSTPYVAPAPPATSSAAPAPSAAPVSGSASAFAPIYDIDIYTPPKELPAITSGIGTPGSTYTGQATYYGAGLGACGWVNSDNNNIVALQEDMFDQYTPTSGLHAGNTNLNTACGKSITITNNGKSYPAVITDRCPGCSANGLDFTPQLFKAVFGSLDAGHEEMTWSFD